MKTLFPSRSHVAAFFLGLTSLVSQIILLREFLTIFHGNETVYSLILGCWFFGVACGSFLFSRKGLNSHVRRPCVVVILTGAAVILPATVVAIRCLPMLLGVRTGEIIGIGPMLGPLFFLSLPVSLMLGGIFALLCRLLPEDRAREAMIPGLSGLYILEASGAAVGGILMSFLLLSWLPAMTIMAGVGGVHLVSAGMMALARHRWRKLVVGFAVGYLIFALAGGFRHLDRMSRRWQWQGMDLRHVQDSRYGNIAVVEVGEDISIYESGLLSLTTRSSFLSENKIHFPLLAHPDPQRVLLLGSGCDGSLQEILKHPVTAVDYLELDPDLLQVIRTSLPAEALMPLEDPRVHTQVMDGRLWVKQTSARYDAVIINLGDPLSAQINRFYTREFFQELSRILTPQAVVSLTASASENYLNQETQDYLRVIFTTLRSVFPEVMAVPGDTQIFLAARSAGTVSRDPYFYLTRLQERGITTEYFNDAYVPFTLSPGRLDYMDRVLAEKGEVNTDLRPVAYLYDIVLWSTHFDSHVRRLMTRLKDLRLWQLLPYPLLVLLVGGCWKRARGQRAIGLSILTTGCSEIVFQFLVILSFQTLYGYVYQQLGWIMAAFMLGLVSGGFCARRCLKYSREQQYRIYLATQSGICLYPLLIPLLFYLFRDVFLRAHLQAPFALAFSALPFLAGYLGGMQYPLAVSLTAVQTDGPGRWAQQAGGLYALDVLGATGGALLTGSLLIPLLGIQDVAIFFSALNVAVLMLLWRGFKVSGN